VHPEFEVVEHCVMYLPCVRVSMRMGCMRIYQKGSENVGKQVKNVNDGIASVHQEESARKRGSAGEGKLRIRGGERQANAERLILDCARGGKHKGSACFANGKT
jgi:hypothetical protein